MPHPNKKAYLASAEAALLALDGRLDRLYGVAARLASEERRLAAERMLDTLRGIRNRAGAKLEDVRRAPEDAWSGVKVHAEEAITELGAAVGRLESLLHAEAA